jgi:hypothetical protein
MDIQALRTELDAGHPDTGAYNADSLLAAGELNAVIRTRNRSSLSGDAMFAATNASEWTALTDHQQNLWVAFTGKESIDPFGSANVALVTSLFGGGSATLTALAALRKEDVSRAVELGLGTITPGDVEIARAQ